jgi:hypothetical protein
MGTRLLACNCSSSSLFFSSYSAVVLLLGRVPPTREADWVLVLLICLIIFLMGGFRGKV